MFPLIFKSNMLKFNDSSAAKMDFTVMRYDQQQKVGAWTKK